MPSDFDWRHDIIGPSQAQDDETIKRNVQAITKRLLEGVEVPPVEEAQRCVTCKHKKTAHVENEDEWGHCNDCGPEFAGVHEFDAEDEGARPPVAAETKLYAAIANFVSDRAEVGLAVASNNLEASVREFEAAIRKEATAAQVELEEAAYRHAEHWQRLYNEVFDQATVERTRAEAAEGALREIANFKSTRMLPRTAVADIMRATARRALTAESVTPGAEG